KDVGGYPELKTAAAPADIDHDGMPDDWEEEHGLNPSDRADGARDKDKDGYTNVEEYLNHTDPTQFVDYTDLKNNVHSYHRGSAKVR
ncbi:MAG: polysaccharide lyase, partial [Candidatus Brocadiae bacterium]|nr:polysaccharide lyase [Candidatus Brocadiia bacterium]